MISYATIGTNDLARATDFYDKILEPLGGRRIFELGGRMQFYGSKHERAGMIAVCQPYDGEPARPGNGAMFGLPAKTREEVDAVHAAALAHGGTCEGEPGSRTDTFYGAYFRDLDGNKLCVFKMG